MNKKRGPQQLSETLIKLLLMAEESGCLKVTYEQSNYMEV